MTQPPCDLATVTVSELKNILDAVGVHISGTTLRKLMEEGTIKYHEVLQPLHKRALKVIPATEVDRILQLYGKEWPRDRQGDGLLDPVGYMQRKTRGEGPRMISPGEE